MSCGGVAAATFFHCLALISLSRSWTKSRVIQPPFEHPAFCSSIGETWWREVWFHLRSSSKLSKLLIFYEQGYNEVMWHIQMDVASKTSLYVALRNLAETSLLNDLWSFKYIVPFAKLGPNSWSSWVANISPLAASLLAACLHLYLDHEGLSFSNIVTSIPAWRNEFTVWGF